VMWCLRIKHRRIYLDFSFEEKNILNIKHKLNKVKQNNKKQMGIYSSGKIFGIKIYKFDNDEFSDSLLEKKHDEVMTQEQMREAYLFYTELEDKSDIFLKIYTECTSTHDPLERGSFMMWYPMSLTAFLEKFASL
jgi:hypothetical protein